MQARLFAAVIFLIPVLLISQDNSRTRDRVRRDETADPELPDLWDDYPLHMLPIPRVMERTSSRTASAWRLADSWNHLIEEVQRHPSSFTAEESAALQAILLQIQSGLAQIGLSPPPNASIRIKAVDILQLVPNTVALRGFFERKRREQPKAKEFKNLCRFAGTLAHETRNQAPVTRAEHTDH